MGGVSCRVRVRMRRRWRERGEEGRTYISDLTLRCIAVRDELVVVREPLRTRAFADCQNPLLLQISRLVRARERTSEERGGGRTVG